MCAASALLWWCLYSLYQRQSRCLRAADFNIATQTRPLQLESFDMCLYLFSWMCVLPAPPQPHPETREQCWQVIRLLTRSAFREFRQPDWLKPRHTIKPSLGNGEKKSIFDGFVFFLSDLLKKKKKRHPGRLYFDSGPQRNSRSYSINFPSGLTATMSWAAGRCTSSLCAFCAGLIWYTAKKHLQGSAA